MVVCPIVNPRRQIRVLLAPHRPPQAAPGRPGRPPIVPCLSQSFPAFPQLRVLAQSCGDLLFVLILYILFLHKALKCDFLHLVLHNRR